MASININEHNEQIGNCTPPATPTPSTRRSPKKRLSGTIATENHIKSLQHEFGMCFAYESESECN